MLNTLGLVWGGLLILLLFFLCMMTLTVKDFTKQRWGENIHVYVYTFFTCYDYYYICELREGGTGHLHFLTYCLSK